MSLPADGVNANTLAETTTIPTGKKLIFLDPDTNEGGIITLENLTKQILSNLTSQTFNLDQGNKTLLAALNELNSNLRIERNIPDLNIDVSKYINSKISIALFAVQSGTLNRPAESTGYVMCFFWHHGGWCTQLFIPDYAGRNIKIRTHADTYWSDWINIK